MDLHSVHFRRETPPDCPGSPVNRLYIEGTGNMTAIRPKQSLSYPSSTHVCMIHRALMCNYMDVNPYKNAYSKTRGRFTMKLNKLKFQEC